MIADVEERGVVLPLRKNTKVLCDVKRGKVGVSLSVGLELERRIVIVAVVVGFVAAVVVVGCMGRVEKDIVARSSVVVVGSIVVVVL
jgi:hypothetical protein